ncbi:MAG: hypothetical protein Q7R95_08830, partial [bacterium]|nr:hypothetical protein [bacterium]
MREIIVRLKPGEQVTIKVIEPKSGQPTRKQQVVEDYKELIRKTADDIRKLQSGKIEDRDSFDADHGREFAVIAKEIVMTRISKRNLRQITADVLKNAPNQPPLSEVTGMVNIYSRVLRETYENSKF